jgi:hypothetical protein
MGACSKREYVISVHFPTENRRDRAAQYVINGLAYVISESVITRLYCMLIQLML